MLGGASSSSALARDEAVNKMANQLRNFLSGVYLTLLFSLFIFYLFIFPVLSFR